MGVLFNLHRFLTVGVLILVTACTNRGGVEEFNLYSKAFEQSAATTTAIIDQIAVGEKARRQRAAHKPMSGGIDRVFVVADAEIFSELTDPPLAAQYKRALRAIEAYNKLMLSFATGQGYSQSQALYKGFLGEAVAVGKAFKITTSLAKDAAPIIGALNEALKFVVAGESRAFFREEALKNHDTIVNLIAVMRDGAPTLFKNLTAGIQNDIVNTAATGQSTKKLVKKHDQARVLMSDWVVLMNRNIEALESVKRTIEAPNSGFDVASATQDLADFRAAVGSIKTELAKLNAN
jgi:hypothetical protein